MKNLKKIALSILTVFLVIILAACQSEDSENNEETASVELILDWVPNTNHTGLFVAEEMGFFEEAGVDVTIRRPPEGGGTELVGSGQAEFGISFQDTIAAPFEQGLPVTAVAAIINHNTSGIISHVDAEILDASDMAGQSYGTWNEPIETAMIEYIVEADGGNFEDVELIPNQADNSVVGLANKMFDSAWIYYAWDGVMAEFQDVPTNYFNLTDFAEELDFYSPIIIANNDYIENNPEEAKAVIQAIKKGYQHAMENPEEAADILIQNAPELEEQRDFVVASQEWISDQYANDLDSWGYMEAERWNRFYNWLYENDLIEVNLTETDLFTNKFLGD